MSDRGPHYWRDLNNLARLGGALGFLLIFWGVQEQNLHRNDPPPVASPSDICTFQGQSMPCGSLPNDGIGLTDAAGHSARQPEMRSPPGSFQMGLGFFVMIGALIPGVIAGKNLGRIKNAVTDYTYEQIQEGTVRCPHCGFVNQGNNQFCGRCGKPLAH